MLRVLIALLGVILWCSLMNENSNQEGFSFMSCLNKGFSKDFCVQTPVSYGNNSLCFCGERIGQNLGGWQGSCVCPANISPYFTPYSW